MRRTGFEGAFLYIKKSNMDVKTVLKFTANQDVEIIMSNDCVIITIKGESIVLSYKEFYEFISFLNAIKPLR